MAHQPDHETYTGHAAPHHQASLLTYFAVFLGLLVMTGTAPEAPLLRIACVYAE